MAPQVHPCLCGFTCESYVQMKRHRRSCAPWKNRRDPEGIRVERRRQTCAAKPPPPTPRPPVCIECRQRLDHHDPTCSWHQTEIMRRALLVKHELDPEVFDVFLRLLAKRYR